MTLIFHFAIEETLELPEIIDVVQVRKFSGDKHRVPANVLEFNVEEVLAFLLRSDGVSAFLVESDRPNLTI